MKSKPCICFPLLPFVLLFVFVACNKADQHSEAESEIDDPFELPTNTNPLVVNAPFCPDAPNYGDSIIYTKPNASGDFFVEPVNNIGVQGTYLSWPEGLRLNRNNGAINVSQSETGVRYNIAFIKKGTQDTCVSQLIIGGMTYMDHIYDLENNDTLAKPVFNADPFGPSICDASDDTDYPENNSSGNNKCAFDEASPGQKANDMKLRVRTKSGIINLKKSVADGLFGVNPRNGTTRIVPIQYRLNDASLRAPQQLSVQVIYYDKMSSIPVSLQQEIASKQFSMLTYNVVNGKPRPPYLIIVGLLK